MHLAIDVREACKYPLTGKGRWTEGFVSALYDAGVEMTLFTDQNLPDQLCKKWANAHVWILEVQSAMWHVRAASYFVNQRDLDIYISTVSYIVPRLLRGRKKCVTIVHDLIAFRSESHDWKSKWIERLTLSPAVKHSNLVCTVSNTTANDLVARFPSIQKKVVPIFAGCDVPIANGPSQGTGPIVCTGTLCPRKNQLRLIEAFSKLPEQLQEAHPLILIGARGWNDDDIVQKAQSTPHVMWVGSVTDIERNSLLSKAILCAFPSLYEGFGLPVLEAFCLGIPVLTSENGSLAEVAGDAAYIVDPLDESSIAAGLQKLLEEPSLRDSFAKKGLERAKQFTWEKTAKLFIDAVK